MVRSLEVCGVFPLHGWSAMGMFAVHDFPLTLSSKLRFVSSTRARSDAAIARSRCAGCSWGRSKGSVAYATSLLLLAAALLTPSPPDLIFNMLAVRVGLSPTACLASLRCSKINDPGVPSGRLYPAHMGKESKNQ